MIIDEKRRSNKSGLFQGHHQIFKKEIKLLNDKLLKIEILFIEMECKPMKSQSNRDQLVVNNYTYELRKINNEGSLLWYCTTYQKRKFKSPSNLKTSSTKEIKDEHLQQPISDSDVIFKGIRP